jgi:hypothetical protein
MPNLSHDESLITKSLRELQTGWEVAGGRWNDRARSDFEKAYLHDLIPAVRRAADAMARINRLLRKAIRDCS